MSEETFDQNEARRLIEAALGDADAAREFAELAERAEGSTAAFLAAAEAYGRDDLPGSAAALEGYADATTSVDRAAFDLCAAGAAKVAGLFVGREAPCGHDECSKVLRLDDEGAPNIWIATAIRLVNAAADQQPNVIVELLVMVHGFAGGDGLRTLATSLVDTYTQVSEMVTELP